MADARAAVKKLEDFLGLSLTAGESEAVLKVFATSWTRVRALAGRKLRKLLWD